MDHSNHARLASTELTPDILEGATIYGPDDEKIGSVDHLHGSQVVIDVGGFLGIGAKPVAITTSQLDFMRDEDGGFVLEASTIQDPIGFATAISDEDGPMWGERLTEAVRQYRHWNGILVLANDENNGRVVVGEDGTESFEAHFDQVELERIAHNGRGLRERPNLRGQPVKLTRDRRPHRGRHFQPIPARASSRRPPTACPRPAGPASRRPAPPAGRAGRG